MSEPEDEDNFPNDYDGFDFDNIPELQAPTILTPEIIVPSVNARSSTPLDTASPAPSTGSNSVEDMDPTFLAAIDALEARALSEMPRGVESLPRKAGDHPTDDKILDSSQGENTSDLNQVRGCSTQLPELSSTNRKGKRKAEPQEGGDVRSILAGYETELTCPICCDLLVAAHVANPCGHTCCGECSHGWLAQNKCEPSCAVCRSNLSGRKPLLPNFSVDNLVRQHLEALARSGLPEWQERGYRRIEWNKRVECWKKQSVARAAKEKSKETSRLRRRQQRYYEVEDYPWATNESVDEEEDAIVVRAMPRRGTRPRH